MYCTENGIIFRFFFLLTDKAEPNSSKLLSEPFQTEDPQLQLKWTAYFEFAHNQEVGDLTWEKVNDTSDMLHPSPPTPHHQI